jgi:protein-tyrosine phosphatase
MKKIKSIMFVCLGNICRSPLAEAIAKKKISEFNLDIEVASSGTAGYHIGEMACNQSLNIAKKNNINLTNHRAQKLTQEHINKYDLFIALDQSNYNHLKKYNIDVRKLGDFGFDGNDVPDPYFTKNIEVVFDMIERAVQDLLNEIN